METHRAGRFQVSFPSGAAPRESWAFPESRSDLAREYDPSFYFLRDQENMEPARRIYVEISSASAVGSSLQSFRRVRS